ncbi:hypothetical protein N7468_007632 [Penicillium chermesinum]|uniref:Uncharacterized protein n=1 Tax=Penicillium chermesinum TaxID=63820 RepID=A0A9W9NUD8_9EURO|nr:uncharacterized protein N7468_007632 [Penicillium chermesinum]KAJ5226407.1 hypothetical protein N7468_007632 [Penicillium chermesinum]
MEFKDLSGPIGLLNTGRVPCTPAATLGYRIEENRKDHNTPKDPSRVKAKFRSNDLLEPWDKEYVMRALDQMKEKTQQDTGLGVDCFELLERSVLHRRVYKSDVARKTSIASGPCILPRPFFGDTSTGTVYEQFTVEKSGGLDFSAEFIAPLATGTGILRKQIENVRVGPHSKGCLLARSGLLLPRGTWRNWKGSGDISVNTFNSSSSNNIRQLLLP